MPMACCSPASPPRHCRWRSATSSSDVRRPFMLRIEKHYHGPAAATERLTLPFELRQKSRMRCVLDSGDEVGLFLERGIVLRGGDRLEAADGRIIAVVAAPEPLSVVA